MITPRPATLQKLTAHQHTKLAVMLVPVGGTAVSTLKTTLTLTG